MKKVIIIILAIWTFFAIFTTFLNVTKGIFEFNDLTKLSYEERRQEVYGSLYLKIQANKTKHYINVNKNDARYFYLSNYFLYPKEIRRIN